MSILSFPSLASTSSVKSVQVEGKRKKKRTPTLLNDPFSSFPTPRRPSLFLDSTLRKTEMEM
jgi:hypothetical protein